MACRIQQRLCILDRLYHPGSLVAMNEKPEDARGAGPAPAGPTPQRPHTIALPAFLAGVITLLVSLFAPAMRGVGIAIGDLPPYKIFVLVPAAITLVLAVLAWSKHENKRLFSAALALAAIGVAMEYVIVAVIIAAILYAIGMAWG